MDEEQEKVYDAIEKNRGSGSINELTNAIDFRFKWSIINRRISFRVSDRLINL